MLKIAFSALLIFISLFPGFLFAQVQLRDTVVSWQHHEFTLNSDFSMNNFSTDDNAVNTVTFDGKVLENEFVRLVIIPEYGGRVISFFYKPTQHEFLYQSECGSPYGINEGNFYYNWLMVYGGIFPTFPEPEHGKTWLLPWDYELVKHTDDSVIIRMAYVDESSYSGTPGQFNNGVTHISCQVEIGVYAGTSLWDFDVSLKNNSDTRTNYEYWTCTTLAPGSEIDDTGCPLNSEIVIPVEKYKAGWSPGAWIGNNGGIYDYSAIDFFDEWDDMGIAYAVDLQSDYWGVINHQNGEGIFRIAENDKTHGLKLWTWGRNNVDNNLYDFSNGGADNYIELWGGVSESFFADASLNAQEEISWHESFVPTIGLSAVSEMNRKMAVNIDINENSSGIFYQIFGFEPNQQYHVKLTLESGDVYEISNETITTSLLGNTNSFALESVPPGTYQAILEVYDTDYEQIMIAKKEVTLLNTGFGNLSGNIHNELIINRIANNVLSFSLPENSDYSFQLYSMNGQLLSNRNFRGNSAQVNLPGKGLYVAIVRGNNTVYRKKLLNN